MRLASRVSKGEKGDCEDGSLHWKRFSHEQSAGRICGRTFQKGYVFLELSQSADSHSQLFHHLLGVDHPESYESFPAPTFVLCSSTFSLQRHYKYVGVEGNSLTGGPSSVGATKSMQRSTSVYSALVRPGLICRKRLLPKVASQGQTERVEN